MSKRRTNATRLSARLSRIESKCSHIERSLRTLRATLAPTGKEIDELIERMHTTARALKEQSERERACTEMETKG